MRTSLLIILAGLAAVAKSHQIKSYDSDATVLLGKCTTERVDQCPLDFPESWATVPGNPRKETFLTGRESPCRTFKSAFRARDLKICPCTSCDCEECKDVAFQSCVVAPKGNEWKAICPVSPWRPGDGEWQADASPRALPDRWLGDCTYQTPRPESFRDGMGGGKGLEPLDAMKLLRESPPVECAHATAAMLEMPSICVLWRPPPPTWLVSASQQPRLTPCSSPSSRPSRSP